MRSMLVWAAVLFASTACDRLRSDPSGDASAASASAASSGATGATGGGRSCLVGIWQQTPESLLRVAQRTAARGIHNASCSVGGGSTKLELRADHSGSDTYLSLKILCTSPDSENMGTTDGALSFTWTATDDQLEITSTGSTAVNHQRISLHGRTMEQNVPLPSASSKPRFRCDADHLHLEYTNAGTTDAFDYARAAGTPAH